MPHAQHKPPLASSELRMLAEYQLECEQQAIQAALEDDPDHVICPICRQNRYGLRTLVACGQAESVWAAGRVASQLDVRRCQQQKLGKLRSLHGRRLMQNMQIIFCACGVRLNTQQDGVNLANMKAALQNVLDEHKYGPAYGLIRTRCCSYSHHIARQTTV